MNQFFENPINPRQFATTTKKIESTAEKSIRLLIMQNSIENFKEPGSPEKKIHMINMNIDRLGRNNDNPFICRIDLEWSLLYIQSTRKNIKAERNACVSENKNPISFR